MTSPGHVDAGVQPGDVLAGKYRVERVLGVGGMGVVVSAHHIQLDEKVALKFLLPQALDSAEAVARFLREARAAVKIKSEHVARVTDVGQLENGSPYIVMEYLDGADLSGLLRTHGPMPIPQAVDFVLQACEALADAHALGIVHRDLKPANLFCIQRTDGQPSIKVLDFGISKITTPGNTGFDLTRTSALMGSPVYMSPEQMTLSKGVDVRTDIWSLGVILFELLTDRVPFEAEAVTQLAVMVSVQPAPLLRELRAEAPAGLEQVIAKCLEKDRARRFQTVGELALALKDFGPVTAHISVDRVLGTLRKAGMSQDLASTGRPAQLVATPPTLVASVAQTDASWGQQTAPGRKSGVKVVLGVVAAAVLAIAVLAGLTVLRRPGTSTVPSAAAAVTGPPPASATVPTIDLVQLPAPTDSPAVASASASARPVAPPSPVVPRNPGRLVPQPPAPPAPNCDPPTWTDDKGHVHLKQGCQ